MSLAPIVLFVYNRPCHTEQTLNALMKNDLADQSILYIYSDGPKENATEEQLKKIQEVRQLIRAKKWCKKVYIIEEEENKGLADSIVDGVTEIVNEYGEIIVLEDDIVTSKGFLKYMNDALKFYEKNEKVFHISAYMYPHHKRLSHTFFFNLPLCWGWATWKRAWTNYNGDTKQLISYFDSQDRWTDFNKFGGKFLEDQLLANQTGKLKTWFIKWHASVMIQGGYCLFPKKSMVNNIGFDSTGVHNLTTQSFAHIRIAKSTSVKRIVLKESIEAEKIIKKFYQQLGKEITKKQKLQNFLRSIMPFKNQIKRSLIKIIDTSIHEAKMSQDKNKNCDISKTELNVSFGKQTKLYGSYYLSDVKIGDYTYINQNSIISKTEIGKFCSIGPNLLCGWGIHPKNGLSTSPMFYSTLKQNGITLSKRNKIPERRWITIGNDVFIGNNVTILDGVSIADGAIIGAGSVVSKDIPPYAIAVGNPIQIIRFRFQEDQIESLLRIKWWNFDFESLKDVETLFFNIDEFIKKYTV